MCKHTSVVANPSRRAWIGQVAALAASATMAPVRVYALSEKTFTPWAAVDEDAVKALVQLGNETLRALGASYGEVRFTHTRRRNIHEHVQDLEQMTVGIRALVQGTWGFAASPVWSADEIVRLARESVNQANVNLRPRRRQIVLAPRPIVHDGRWETPMVHDPFLIHPSEMLDVLNGFAIYTKNKHGKHGVSMEELSAHVSDKRDFVGTTDGSYFVQRFVRTGGGGTVVLEEQRDSAKDWMSSVTPVAMGWEYLMADARRDEIDHIVEELREWLSLPWNEPSVGRFSAVCCGESVATLAADTIGLSCQLDRALGFEANASGTSYLDDPAQMLGTFVIGNPRLTIRANRSMPAGLATAQWDSEGVQPTAFDLVRNGVLQAYQTNRETAGWLSNALGRTISSSGASATPSAWDVPVTHSSNLEVAPGSGKETFDSLLATMGKGIAFSKTVPQIDFQQLGGLGLARRTYKVDMGKKIARMAKIGFLFRTSELWKSLIHTGGESSVQRVARFSSKGEPPQSVGYTVTAPPAVFDGVNVIDILRRA